MTLQQSHSTPLPKRENIASKKVTSHYVFEKLLLIAIEVMGTTHQRIFRTALS
jgi:hypothetical protein